MRTILQRQWSASTDSGNGEPLYPGGAGDYLHVRDYLRIVYERRWLILALMALGLGASIAYNSRATRIFQATATLQIEADPNVLGLERPLVDQRDWMREFLPTQLVILESRELARMAREELNRSRGKDIAATVGSTRNTEVSSTADDGSSAVDNDDGSAPSVAEILEARSVSPVVSTRLVNISFSSIDATQAAEVANALASAFVRWNNEFKKSTTGAASDWLTQQVEEQRKLVKDSEAALQRYREQYGADALRTLPTISNAAIGERQNIVIQKLVELQSASTLARAKTIDKEMQYQVLSSLEKNGQPLDTLPAIATNGFIQGLKGEVAGLQRQLAQSSEQLGDRHPEIIRMKGAIENAERKLQSEISKLAAAIRNEYEEARGREQATAASLEQQKAAVSDLNAKAVEYTALEGEARANRQLLDTLVQRSRQIALARDLPSGNATILDAAEIPVSPIRPRETRNMAMALAGSGALSLTLIFLLEVFNTRMKSPEDVKRHLGMPLLGIAPKVKRRNGHGSLLLSDGAPPQVAELLHSVRTNLVTAPELASAHTVLITSAEPGEGKTLTAANLATSLAGLNQRVLLIDADMRKPRLHELFGETQQPGLTDVLKAYAPYEIAQALGTSLSAAEATRSSAFRKTKVPGLWLMPSGSSSRNPADLLGSARFAELLEMLRQQFDWVVLDSPPVLAVTDPCIIARVASGVLFVVGSGQTSREVASAAVERLDAAGANLVGALLNRVVLARRNASYLPYYHRSYTSYYTQHEESPVLPEAPKPSSSATPVQQPRT